MQLYANTTTLHDFLRISCTKKGEIKCCHKKKLYIRLYENRKYQSKMCTNSLYYVTKNLQYKKTYENDQITHYLEHRGTGTGLVTGHRQTSHGGLHFESLQCESTNRSNSFNIKYSWITEWKGQTSKPEVLALNFGTKPSKCRCPMHSIKFSLVCFFFVY